MEEALSLAATQTLKVRARLSVTLPPTQGLWRIWGGQETLGQGVTLISERVQVDEVFSWGTFPPH